MTFRILSKPNPESPASNYEAIIRDIALTDDLNGSDWPGLRDAIKLYIDKNVALFLTTTEKPPRPAPYIPIGLPSGGLRLPPFLPRKLNPLLPNHIPVSYMDEKEAHALKDQIFTQLNGFESNAPFTVQRLCELCIDPMKHYKSVGKYLRAVEKSILVTSTWDSFPPLTESELHSAGRSAITLGSTLQSAPSTPLFSPIPFLHDDARRSKSRSPPPTPLDLNASLSAASPEVKALGLVDELDDPGPGHMSDHPVPISSVTTTSDPKLFLGSLLQERFVKASEEDPMDAVPGTQLPDAGTGMELDDDKENNKS